MESFYGGPNGQSFLIEKIFNTRSDMDDDASRGWTSPIPVGSYVLVSYGDPTSEAYDENKRTDVNRYKSIDNTVDSHGYNSTIWQKVYNENTSTSSERTGMYYDLITSIAGNTPDIDMVPHWIRSDSKPYIIKVAVNKDQPHYDIYIPRSQTLSITDDSGAINWNQAFNLTYDGTEGINVTDFDSNDENNANTDKGQITTHNTNRPKANPTLKLQIPQARQVVGIEYKKLLAGEAPIFELVSWGSSTPTGYTRTATSGIDNIAVANRALLRLALPASQKIKGICTVINTTSALNNVIKVELRTNGTFNDVVVFDNNTTTKQNNITATIDDPILYVELPRSREFSIGTVTKNTKPSMPPKVSLTEDGNTGDITFNFDLPGGQQVDYTSTSETPNTSPEVTLSKEDTLTPTFNFKLPRSQVLAQPILNPKDADFIPSIDFDDTKTPSTPGAAGTKDSPQITFNLPRSQVLEHDKVLVFDEKPGTAPDVIWHTNGAVAKGGQSYSANINSPIAEIIVPRSQVLAQPKVNPIAANLSPSIDFDDTKTPSAPGVAGTKDSPQITFNLPRSQTIDEEQVILHKEEAGTDPAVKWHTTGTYPRGDGTSVTATIDDPIVEVTIPYSQTIAQVETKDLAPGSRASAQLIDAATAVYPNANKTNPILELSLPGAQKVGVDNSKSPSDADQPPKVSIKAGTENTLNPVFEFELPQNQIMQPAQLTQILGAIEDPVVRYHDDDINKPYLEFQLPRATKFFYGTQLGSRTATILTSDATIADIKPGDYYINSTKGLIFYVTVDNGDGTYTVEFKAILYRPLPALSVTGINPYNGIDATTGDITLNTPKINSSYSDNDLVSWRVNVEMPLAPKVEETHNFIGVDEQGKVTRTYLSNNNTVNFDFQIPRGSQIFSGDGTSFFPILEGKEINEANSSGTTISGAINGTYYRNIETGYIYYLVDDTTGYWTKVNNATYTVDVDSRAKKGDVYINNVTGRVYLYTGNDATTNVSIWTEQNGSLKGPTGDALHIIATFMISVEKDASGNDVANVIYNDDAPVEIQIDLTKNRETELIPNIIETIFSNKGLDIHPTSDNVISVSWKENDILISYWFYRAGNEIDSLWEYALLTSGSNFIVNEYQSTNNTDKAYSINYINSLIGGNITEDNQQRTAFSKEQIYNLLGWGSFSRNDTTGEVELMPAAVTFPAEQKGQTYSAAEVIELLSWGSIEKLKDLDTKGG